MRVDQLKISLSHNHLYLKIPLKFILKYNFKILTKLGVNARLPLSIFYSSQHRIFLKHGI